jgi:hypothetical protein
MAELGLQGAVRGKVKRTTIGLMPSCSPTRRKAPVLVAGSRRRSTAIRIARSLKAAIT